jgi:glycosyltransferase involved in cell wall biosynthesis
MSQPLVSVVCLSYNHSRFVEEAINSVLKQTYKNIEIIVVDDASTDNSVEVIRRVLANYPAIKFISIPKNVGNCRAFNQGLALTDGEFIVDFAADDVMVADRIERQVDFFSTLPPDYGVVFTDAEYIDADGKFVRNHYDYLFEKKLLTKVPQGDVYRNVLSQYFIASPTMLIRREVMDRLDGYDEGLAYEDFDFWVRSARIFKYGFLNEKLTRIRRTGNSMSSGWYKQGDRQLHSTYLVCRKAQRLSFTPDDDAALLKRARYEFRQSAFSGNFYEAELFYNLILELASSSWAERLLFRMVKFRVPLSSFRAAYHRFRFNQSNFP